MKSATEMKRISDEKNQKREELLQKNKWKFYQAYLSDIAEQIENAAKRGAQKVRYAAQSSDAVSFNIEGYSVSLKRWEIFQLFKEKLYKELRDCGYGIEEMSPHYNPHYDIEISW